MGSKEIVRPAREDTNIDIRACLSLDDLDLVMSEIRTLSKVRIDPNFLRYFVNYHKEVGRDLPKFERTITFSGACQIYEVVDCYTGGTWGGDYASKAC